MGAMIRCETVQCLIFVTVRQNTMIRDLVVARHLRSSMVAKSRMDDDHPFDDHHPDFATMEERRWRATTKSRIIV
jgi:hypothetical protein